MPNSSIWFIDEILSGATTLGQSGPGSNGIEEVLHIPQSFCIIGASPWNGFVSLPGHVWEKDVICLQSILKSQPTELPIDGILIDEPGNNNKKGFFYIPRKMHVYLHAPLIFNRSADIYLVLVIYIYI